MFAVDVITDVPSWETVGTMVVLLGAIVSGGARLGTLANQIRINTVRLDRIEAAIEMIRNQILPHDADTGARLPLIEKRLDRLEEK